MYMNKFQKANEEYDLRTSAAKTKIVILKRSSIVPNVFLHDNCMEQVKNASYLGHLIDMRIMRNLTNK